MVETNGLLFFVLVLLIGSIYAQSPRPPTMANSYWTEVRLETTFHFSSGADEASGTLYYDSPNNRMLTKTEVRSKANFFFVLFTYFPAEFLIFFFFFIFRVCGMMNCGRFSQ
jgi:hypothetical protein